MQQQGVQTGQGNILVQAAGNGIDIRIGPEGHWLELARRHVRAMAVRKDLDLPNPFTRAIPLVGREPELASLLDWLQSPAPVSARCLTGRAGSGKTRLALELCAEAEALPKKWHAGFATTTASPFAFNGLANPSGWRWPARCLVVVDYAAAKTTLLRDLLTTIIDRGDDDQGPLRLLLLERHADREFGWWPELSRPRSWSEEPLGDLFDPPEPLPLQPLADPDHQRQVLGSVMLKASERAGRSPALAPPPRGADADFDRRLADPNLRYEPLHLAMAGLNAVHADLGNLLAIPRTDLARRIAHEELERIARLARSRDLGGDFLRHMAAVVTLTAGVSRDGIEAVIEAEQAALYDQQAGAPSQIAATLRDAMPAEAADELAPILPDIIGEAAILEALGRRTRQQQAGTIARAATRSAETTVSTVIRTVQDHAERDDHAALGWLEELAAQAEPAARRQLANQLPQNTVRLRPLMAEIEQRILRDLREAAGAGDEEAVFLLPTALSRVGNALSDLGRREAALAAAEEAAAIRRELAAARPDAFRPDLASSLNNLATRLSSLGRREAALAAAEEAAGLYRELAAARPDAFRPNLATSLGALGMCLEASERMEDAALAAHEGVATLAPAFLALPQAFAGVMLALLRDYLRRSEALGQEPDAVLLGPIIETFQRLQEQASEEEAG